MRKYFTFSIAPFPETDNQKLTTEVNRFCMKYHFGNHQNQESFNSDHRSGAGSIWWDRFPSLKPDIRMEILWAYSEEGQVFEFFTGTKLGQVHEHYTDRYHYYFISDAYGKFSAFPQTEKDFAEKVAPLLSDAKEIKKILTQYFSILASSNAVKDEYLRKKEVEQAAEKQEQLSAVERFLKNRK